MKHTAGHPLPTSYDNGRVWDRGVGLISATAECRKCRDHFDVDEDWVNRHIESRIRHANRDFDCGRITRRQLKESKDAIDRDRREFADYLKRLARLGL